jgi:hypothetical protein
VSHEELPLFTHWTKVVADLLSRTEKFPKKVRFTFSGRIDGLALDVVEKIVEARYTRDKTAILRSINLDIEKLRVLLRISHDQGYLPHRGYAHASVAPQSSLGYPASARATGCYGWRARHRHVGRAGAASYSPAPNLPATSTSPALSR